MEGYVQGKEEASNAGQRDPFPSSFPVISGCHPFWVMVMTQRRQVTQAHDCHHDEVLLLQAPILFLQSHLLSVCELVHRSGSTTLSPGQAVNTHLSH